jgi:cyclophilin family peptidyl-prolyl cis-trans isomerase
MKLSDHVDKIRVLTHKSFFNYFARLEITAKKVREIEKLPEDLKAKREKVDRVIKSHMEETGSFAGKLIGCFPRSSQNGQKTETDPFPTEHGLKTTKKWLVKNLKE